jgi:hypothetical protein
MAKVTLQYKRVGHSYEGSFRYVHDNGRCDTHEEFACEYEAMLQRLSDIMVQHYQAEESIDVVLQRTDRAGLLPMTLDAQTTQLLRTDSVAGIAALTYTQPSTPLGAVAKKKAEKTVYEPASLRAGLDTLAQAFGANVYVRAKEGQLECPGCGIWVPVPAGSLTSVVVTCAGRCKEQLVFSLYEQWAAVATVLLLRTELPRFYLPREWNYGKPWVSRETLQQKYDTFLKEKEQAHG